MAAPRRSVRRKGPGHGWTIPMAGRFKAQESVVEAASREAREELGVVLAAKDLVAVTTMRRSQQTSLAI
ncbi:hypothetical protein CVS27_16490 [Arthrobacter glacialis]|uniref:Nudix hydrolase domain-containing protein n=1 Tax=Arthrobacter glacialis TaxID=1664 RepID=A0A2S3ZT46_ARTGL|nr:hypothetical protein CVS27_16490 [Arthrobacter glacialis]